MSTEELERQLELSTRHQKNIEFILASAPKVKEVYEQLGKIDEMGIAPIQKALDEIGILKQHQTERHQLLVEVLHGIEQVQVRNSEDDELIRTVLKLLRDKLAK